MRDEWSALELQSPDVRILKFPLLGLAMLLATNCGAPAPRPPQNPVTVPDAQANDDDFALSEAMPPRVYTTETGIRVDILFLAQRVGQPDRALLRFTGATYPTAGKVMLAEDAGRLGFQSWKVRYDGRDSTLLTIDFQRSGGSQSRIIVKLFMPRSQGFNVLALDEDASKNFNVEEFVALHKRHVADGSLAVFAQLDRPFHEGNQTRWLEHYDEAVVKECGQSIPYEIDWASIADADITSRSPCGAILEATALACHRDAMSRAITLGSIKKLRCSHAPKSKLAMSDDGTLAIDIPTTSPPNGKTLYKEIVSLLGFGEVVLTDARGRILVFDPDDVYGENASYLGDGKELYKLRNIENALGSWDPHATYGSASYRRNSDGGWSVSCRNKTIDFKAVSAGRRQTILRDAERKETRWKRHEFALARDNRGIYYYVDSYDREFGGKNYRVFKGPRGQLAETPLVDIVDDSDGLIFATNRGKLRLVLGADQRQEALWIEGKTRHKLVVLPITENRELIYTGLGVYDTVIMGTVCE